MAAVPDHEAQQLRLLRREGEVVGLWGHGFLGGLGYLAGLIWLAAVIYILTLATRLVRAIERIANKFESKAP